MIDLNTMWDEMPDEKIKLIKSLREQTGLGLNDAKDIIDKVADLKGKDRLIDVNYLIEENGAFKKVPSPVPIVPEIGRGFIDEIYNANRTRVLKYQVEIWHAGLNEHKLISAPDRSMLKTRYQMQFEKWNTIWAAQQERKNKESEKTGNADEAVLRTQLASSYIEELENLLQFTLDKDDRLNWDDLRNNDSFIGIKPIEPIKPLDPLLPAKPSKLDEIYQPKKNMFYALIKPLKDKAQAEADSLYEKAEDIWKLECTLVEQNNKKNQDKYGQELKKYQKESATWEKNKAAFIKKQNEFNQLIDSFQSEYLELKPSAIEEYSKEVLNRSRLPLLFKKEYELSYQPETKILIVDYLLPAKDQFPRLKEVKYTASKNEFKETTYNDNFMDKLFDDTIYKFILRVMHELFESDTSNALEAISMNAWVNFINRATGNPENACIASIQVKKTDFLAIDLRNVDPKTCFKSLKGVGSSKLAGITPIQPILTINKEDKRFISSYDVAHTLDESMNLAIMNWEDFEHLIRELFEKEFSFNGGEVKVTQASKDGGVDAVVFDPDPIRGGKIIIQAKRYANTVGVSAVRDLYGTVMNEGAMLGILVTTADYGPDAHNFASNKPLTLLNGGNLLSLLEKHGHRAKIDLKEAKLINSMNRRT